MREIYQNKQQQNLQAYLGTTNILSEDRPQQQMPGAALNSSMTSTQ